MAGAHYGKEAGYDHDASSPCFLATDHGDVERVTAKEVEDVFANCEELDEGRARVAGM